MVHGICSLGMESWDPATFLGFPNLTSFLISESDEPPTSLNEEELQFGGMAAQWSSSCSTWSVFQLYLEFLLFSLFCQCSGLIWALQLSWEDGLPPILSSPLLFIYSPSQTFISLHPPVFKLCILKYLPAWPNSTDSSQVLKSCLISGLPLLQSDKFKLSFVCTVYKQPSSFWLSFRYFFPPCE